MVRPHVEFGNSVWCTFKLGDLEEIEKIQKGLLNLHAIWDHTELPATQQTQHLPPLLRPLLRPILDLSTN